MKAVKTLVVLILSIIVLGFTYATGHENGSKEGEVKAVEMQREIAKRYLKYTFNPQNVEQQCAFEYTIYGDCDED